jgi:hypothetical protein
VEADYGGLQLGAVELLGFALGTQEEGGGVQFVEIQGIGQFKRLLLEVIVDLIFIVVNLDLA